MKTRRSSNNNNTATSPRKLRVQRKKGGEKKEEQEQEQPPLPFGSFILMFGKLSHERSDINERIWDERTRESGTRHYLSETNAMISSKKLDLAKATRELDDHLAVSMDGPMIVALRETISRIQTALEELEEKRSEREEWEERHRRRISALKDEECGVTDKIRDLRRKLSGGYSMNPYDIYELAERFLALHPTPFDLSEAYLDGWNHLVGISLARVKKMKALHISSHDERFDEKVTASFGGRDGAYAKRSVSPRDFGALIVRVLRWRYGVHADSIMHRADPPKGWNDLWLNMMAALFQTPLGKSLMISVHGVYTDDYVIPTPVVMSNVNGDPNYRESYGMIRNILPALRKGNVDSAKYNQGKKGAEGHRDTIRPWF